jgi:hypothetical protein
VHTSEEVAMPKASVLVHRTAPAPAGPIACSLSPDDYAGRLVADLEVPAEAAPTLDGLAVLAELAAPGVAG